MAEKQVVERVQVLDRALNILDVLMLSKKPMGVNELAKRQEITPSAAFRILKTLELNGWVFQLADGKYIPGQKISFVNERTNLYLALADVAYPVMDRLTKKEILPMNLVVRQNQRYFILQQTRSARYVDFVAPIGSDLPLHASAGGKILLCEMPEVLRTEVLDNTNFHAMTPNTICDKRAFTNELSLVRKQGYALDYYESLENTCCIAVPVRDDNGDIIAALSFSGITGIKSAEDLLYYLPMLQSAAKEISDHLFLLRQQFQTEEA